MRKRTQVVLIDGVEVSASDIRTDHDVDQGVATGAVTVRARRPSQVEPGAPVDIYAGYDGATWPIFSGRIAEYQPGFSRSGAETRVELEGWGHRLYFRALEDRGFNGPIQLDTWWRSLCYIQGVKRWRSDTPYDDAGAIISLGDNADYNNGWVPIDPDNPGRQIDRVVRHFGYRSFETPLGQRLQRVSGLPADSATGLLTYEQGVNVLSVEHPVTLAGMVNAVDVRGAEYQAPDTSEVAIRSFTGTYTPDTDLYGATGLDTLKVGPDAMLGSTTLADAARRAYEIDRGGEQIRYRWTVPGDPERIPGEKVAITSAIVNGSTDTSTVGVLIAELPRPVWLMKVSHILPARSGWITTLEGWAGTGSALPAGDDTTEIAILGSAGVHLGNEYLSHYRNPSPNGNISTTEDHIAFPVPDTYTTLTIRGWHHGSNSFVRNQGSTASRFEIYQFGTRVASGEMPRSDENLEQRLDYDLDSTWDALVVPLTGSLDPDPTGANTYLSILSGEDRDVGDYDDFEVRNLVLYAGGVGAPEPLG